jgi:hypothetical protein
MNATQRNVCERTARDAIHSALAALSPEAVKAIAAEYLTRAIEDGMRAEYVSYSLNVTGVEADRIVSLLEQ